MLGLLPHITLFFRIKFLILKRKKQQENKRNDDRDGERRGSMLPFVNLEDPLKKFEVIFVRSIAQLTHATKADLFLGREISDDERGHAGCVRALILHGG